MPAERGGPGCGTDPHPILRTSVQAGDAGADQSGEAVDQKLFQHLTVADAEIGQRLGIHTDAAAQPLIGEMLLAQPHQFAGTADAFNRRIEPKRRQDARVRRRMPRRALDRLNGRMQRRDVQSFDKAPPHPNTVVGRYQIIQANRPQLDLTTFRCPQSRLGPDDLFRCRMFRQVPKQLSCVVRRHRSTAK